jgi:monoamine oxidase
MEVFMPRIAVIGGGISGLATAKELVDKGYEVVLYEARNYFGGRIKSVNVEGANGPMEEGANWIEGITEDADHQFNQLADLECKSLNVQAGDFYYKGLRVDEKLIESMAYKAGLSAYAKWRNFKANFEGTVDSCFQELGESLKEDGIILDSGLRDLFKALIIQELYGASEALSFDKINCNLDARTAIKKGNIRFKRLERGEQEDFVVNGYQRIPNEIVSALEGNSNFIAKLEHQVECIDSSGLKTKITASSANESVVEEFDGVVCTIPAGVLKADHKTLFNPPLPKQKANVLERMQMAKVTKVFLTFDDCHWPRDVPFFHFAVDGTTDVIHIGNMAHSDVDKGNILYCWFDGDQAEYTSKEEIAARAMDYVRKIHANIPEPSNVHVTDWQHDPLARGAWVSTHAKGMRYQDMYDLVSFMPERNLWFAGEHSAIHNGTVHGAYQSGIATANDITHLYTYKDGLYSKLKEFMQLHDETQLDTKLAEIMRDCKVEEAKEFSECLNIDFSEIDNSDMQNSEQIFYNPLLVAMQQGNQEAFKCLVKHGQRFSHQLDNEIKYYYESENLFNLKNSAYIRPLLLMLLHEPQKVGQFFETYLDVAPEHAEKEIKHFLENVYGYYSYTHQDHQANNLNRDESHEVVRQLHKLPVRVKALLDDFNWKKIPKEEAQPLSQSTFFAQDQPSANSINDEQAVSASSTKKT